MGTLSIMHLLPVILLLPLLLAGVTPAPTQEEWPGQWYYMETLLQGGKVLTLMPDRQVRMHSKHHEQHQEWRLKTDGCLVNKAEPKLCLALEGNIEGSLLSMHEANGLESQKWKWKTNYLESYIRSNLSTTISCWTSYGRMYQCIHQELVSMSGIMTTRILRGGRWSLSSNI